MGFILYATTLTNADIDYTKRILGDACYSNDYLQSQQIKTPSNFVPFIIRNVRDCYITTQFCTDEYRFSIIFKEHIIQLHEFQTGLEWQIIKKLHSVMRLNVMLI